MDNNSNIEGDICIIGAGTVGISIAMELINSSYKVILLEGGGFEYDDNVQDLYKGKITGQKYYPLKSSRLHYFGGTSQHWGGMCTPLDKIDFKERNWVENSGWPIEKKDLDPFYKRAQSYLDLGPYEYNLEYWRDKDPSLEPLPFDKKIIWNKMWQFSSPTRFGDKYKNTIIESKNIHLYTYANVVNILTDENVSNVSEVIIKNNQFKEHRVTAKHFILACGAIQNSRLLLASNTQMSSGLGNSNDIVGRYFMEHPEISSAELWLSSPLPMDLYTMRKEKNYLPRAELAITEKMQSELKILNGTCSLSPLINTLYRKPNMETWQEENPVLSLKNYGRENSLFEKIQHKINIIQDSRIKDISFAFQLYIRMEQAPNPLSRITLDAEKDNLGVPRANLHWELSSLEKRSIRKVIETIANQAGVKDIGRLKLKEFLINRSDTSNPQFNGGWHHIGTTRMNNDPKKGVTDSNCKIHGINNLFVAGSGCFPTSGAANPTLTIVALGIRLSDHIKRRMLAD
jgi:choline dehydrogenase-like flavoprotein